MDVLCVDLSHVPPQQLNAHPLSKRSSENPLSEKELGLLTHSPVTLDRNLNFRAKGTPGNGYSDVHNP